MDLRQALGVLSKSSPYAVSTEHSDLISSDLDNFKSYLYIETDIEKDFRQLIENLSEKKIIFLCGSSGDGKSEIMTRYSQDTQYSHIDFHLDATHSFDPKLDAIATLDNIYTAYKVSDRPLIVGINLGMMANYAKEGSAEHDEIKAAMQLHIDKGGDSENINFLSFEEHKYAKFCFKDGIAYSDFASQFMQRLTRESAPDFANPFWDLMLETPETEQDIKAVANFKLLSFTSVQDTIIELLMKARLAKDQFLTARALLDFIYSLLVGKDYLFDNLFLSKNNELSEKIESFDPALIRTEKLDNLVLTLRLNLGDPVFSNFVEDLKRIGVNELKEPASFIRLFYVFRNATFGNNYHQYYSREFSNELLANYSSVLIAHQDYKNEHDENEKNIINNFYKHNLFTALWRYINRSAPELKSKQFLIAKENGVLFATELKLLVDWPLIAEYQSTDLMAFKALIKVNKKPIEPALPVNINLYELLQRLNLGYRPNKYDKSCVLLLDELVEQIKLEMAKSETLVIVDENDIYEAERDGSFIEITER
jgi:DNA phosphorothioation-dependent restriction protein DptF